jgi:hypothetical protein
MAAYAYVLYTDGAFQNDPIIGMHRSLAKQDANITL